MTEQHLTADTFSHHYQEAILSLKRRMLAEEVALEAMGLDRGALSLYCSPPGAGEAGAGDGAPGAGAPGAGGGGAGGAGGHGGIGAAPPTAHTGPAPVPSSPGSTPAVVGAPATGLHLHLPSGYHHHHHHSHHHHADPGYHHMDHRRTDHHHHPHHPNPHRSEGDHRENHREDHREDHYDPQHGYSDGARDKGPRSPSGHHQGGSMPMQEFVNKSNLHQHSKEVHRMQEKMHKCVKCFKSFPSSQQLNQHMLVHNNIRKYRCQYCDKAFKQLSHVQQHQRRHTGERPYKCTIEGCDKAFAQLSNLQQHQRNHDARRQQSDRKPYQCSICDRRFATEVSLNNHISKVHNPDSPAYLAPAPVAVNAASSPSSAVSMVTAAAAATTSASLPTSSFPVPPQEGLPPLVHGPLVPGPLRLQLAPPAGSALEKALMREAISAALAATHAHQELPQHPAAAAPRPGSALAEPEPADDNNKMAPPRRMEELSKRDLNLLRFSRAGLYDFPTQVPPLHPAVYGGSGRGPLTPPQ